MRDVLRIGEWTVRPADGEMARGDEVVRLEARTLRLLTCLAEHAGEVVSIDQLLDEAWPGVVVTPDSVYQAVTALRRLLGDDARQPRYIATVPRRGYRLVAAVEALAVPPPAEPEVPKMEVEAPAATAGMPEQASPIPVSAAATGRRKLALPAALAAIIVAGLLAVPMLRNEAVGHPLAAPATVAPTTQAIAVMPFLDLTDEMSEEPFADGMVEEVIGKLSKFPALKVAPPASSFFYKEKKITLAEFARQLHVTYVVDGSVRKAGETLRVAARLTRADDGFVVWSETYDRNWRDKLAIQNDIAEQVAKALATRLH